MFSKRKGKLILTSLMATTMIFSSQSVLANDSIHDLTNQKNSLSEQMESKKEVINEKKQELNKVEKQIDSTENQLLDLQKKINATSDLIASKEEVIESTQKEINEIQAVIEEKEADLEIKKEELKKHIQLMNSSGKVQFLEVLFRSESLAQFINRYEKYQEVMNKGRELHDEVLAEIQYIEEQKRIVEEKKEKLEVEKANLETVKKQQVTQEKEQAKLLAELESKEQHIHDEIDVTEGAMKSIASQVAQMEAKIAKEQEKIRQEKLRKEEAARKAAEEAAKKTGEKVAPKETTQAKESITSGLGNGVLASPMKRGTYYLTSHFGYRIHPIHNERRLHNGTDYGAPLGTPIYAMEDGYVLYAGPARGYGNWIVIKHDNGLYTGYAHMYSNQVYVSPGQRVSRGQKIGGVGSSGTSTGNHLHFFVSKTGASSGFVNPLNYIER